MFCEQLLSADTMSFQKNGGEKREEAGMEIKKDFIGEILAETREIIDNLIGHKSYGWIRRRILLLCGLLAGINIPNERKKQVSEVISEAKIATAKIIDPDILEGMIEKYK